MNQKSLIRALCALFALLMLLGCTQPAEAAAFGLFGSVGDASPAGETAQQETAAEAPEAEEAGQRIEIKALDGSICIPDGYYAFSEDLPYTEEMLRDINVAPANFEAAMPLLQGQTIIVPAGEPFSDSLTIYLKVKDKKYDDITLAELSDADFKLFAGTVVLGFGVSDYETVEGNGLRFFVFNADQGMGNVLRFATVLNGHMIYLYVNTGKENPDEELVEMMTDMALSIKHDLK